MRCVTSRRRLEVSGQATAPRQRPNSADLPLLSRGPRARAAGRDARSEASTRRALPVGRRSRRRLRRSRSCRGTRPSAARSGRRRRGSRARTRGAATRDASRSITLTSAYAPGRSTPRSATPKSSAVSDVRRRIASSIVYFCRSRTQCSRNQVGKRRVHDQADVRAGVAETDRHPRVVQHLLDRVHALVQEREVEQGAAARLERDADERLRDRSRRAVRRAAASEVSGSAE